MSLLRFMAIAVVTIAIAVAVVSNLTDTFRLVFWNAQTVPVHLGLLALGAGSTGILASVLLRLLAISPRRGHQTQRRTAQPEFDQEPLRPMDQPSRDLEEPEEYEEYPVPRDSRRSINADREASQYENRDEQRANAPIYDANYRVINAPKNPATPQPQVDSKLQPDGEDWGFDFEEDSP